MWIKEIATYGHDSVREYILIYKLIHFGEIIYRGPDFSVIWGFLSPIYYYIIAPVILIGRFHPLSLPIFTLIINLFTLILIIYVLNKTINFKTAIIGGVLYGFSFIVILQAAYGLNPNLMPIWSILLVISIYKILNNSINYYSVVGLGISISMLLSFHPSGLFIIPGLLALFIINYKGIKLNKKYILVFFITIFIFLIVPYSIQEKKFNYWTIKQTIKYVQSSQDNTEDLNDGFINSIVVISKNTTNSIFLVNSNLSVIFFAILFILLIRDNYLYFKTKENKSFKLQIAVLLLFYIITFVIIVPFKTRDLYEWWFHTVYIPIITLYISIYIGRILNKYSIFVFSILYLALNIHLFLEHVPEVDSYMGTHLRALVISQHINEYVNDYQNDNNYTRFKILGSSYKPFNYDLWYNENDSTKKQKYLEHLIWDIDQQYNILFYVESNEFMDAKRIRDTKVRHGLENVKNIYTDEKGSVFKFY